MNHQVKSFKLPVVLGLFIACGLFFNACTTSRNGTKIKTYKNWINWNFTIKPGTSDENITRTKAGIEKYISDYINKIDPGHKRILVITTTYQTDFSEQTGVQLIVNVKLGYVMLQGVRVPTPAPPAPNFPEFANPR